MSASTRADRARARADAERFAFAAAVAFPDLVEESGLSPAMFATELLAQAFAAVPRAGIRTTEGQLSVVEVASLAGISVEALRPLLQARVYTADQARTVFARLRDLATVDAVVGDLRAALAEPLDETDATGTLLARLEAVLRSHVDSDVDDESPTILEVAEAYLRERSEELRLGRRRGVVTGLEILDEWAGGLNAGELTTIVAGGGVGKTTFALDVARRVAANGTSVLYWSAEMTARQMGQRELHAAMGRPVSDTSVTAVDLAAAFDALRHERHGDRVRYRWPSRPTAARLLAAARREQSRHGLGLVVLDHLGHFDCERPRANEQEQVAIAVQASKDLAKALDVPFLLLTHFNRQGLIRGSERVNNISDNVLELKRDLDNRSAPTEARLSKARQTGETHRAMFLEYSPKWQTYIETGPGSPSAPPASWSQTNGAATRGAATGGAPW